jgi:hypothetical protein
LAKEGRSQLLPSTARTSRDAIGAAARRNLVRTLAVIAVLVGGASGCAGGGAASSTSQASYTRTVATSSALSTGRVVRLVPTRISAAAAPRSSTRFRPRLSTTRGSAGTTVTISGAIPTRGEGGQPVHLVRLAVWWNLDRRYPSPSVPALAPARPGRLIKLATVSLTRWQSRYRASFIVPNARTGAYPVIVLQEGKDGSVASVGSVSFLLRPARQTVDGVSMKLARGWTLRRDPVPVLVEPSLPFEVGSWRVPSGGNGCAPSRAINSQPATSALFWLYEYAPGHFRKADFPPQPTRFRLGRLGGPYECLGVRAYTIRFRSHQRYFQVHVILGKHASRLRGAVIAALSSLRIEPTR